MQVSVESTSNLERRMQVQVPAERVSAEIAARLKDLSRTARLKGFRPGKAPIDVIRRQFGTQIHREVIGDLLQSTFAEAVTQQRLSPAGNPRIQPQNISEGSDLTYLATFEVLPELALPPLETLEFERVTAEVTDSDVDAMILRLRKQQPKFAATTRAAVNGDRVTIDFEGSLDGKPFAGGKGENVGVMLGEGRMLPEFESGLLGAVAGEVRSVVVNFPADYRATELAGKAADFKISVKSVEEASLPELDDEFCSAFGVTEGGVPALREEVAANMRRELGQALRSRNNAAVLEKLRLAHPFDVPNTLIEAQVRNLQIDAMRRAGIKDPAQAPAAQQFVEIGRRRAALGLILADLIQRNKLSADPKRVQARLEELAGSYGDVAAIRQSYVQDPEIMRQIENLALEDQVVEWIYAHGKVQEVASSFKELMKFEA